MGADVLVDGAGRRRARRHRSSGPARRRRGGRCPCRRLPVRRGEPDRGERERDRRGNGALQAFPTRSTTCSSSAGSFEELFDGEHLLWRRTSELDGRGRHGHRRLVKPDKLNGGFSRRPRPSSTRGFAGGRCRRKRGGSEVVSRDHADPAAGSRGEARGQT